MLPAIALGGLAAGCGTIHPEVRQLAEIGDDSYGIVDDIGGRFLIEIVPVTSRIKSK